MKIALNTPVVSLIPVATAPWEATAERTAARSVAIA
jgi:hypothetical protein